MHRLEGLVVVGVVARWWWCKSSLQVPALEEEGEGGGLADRWRGAVTPPATIYKHEPTTFHCPSPEHV